MIDAGNQVGWDLMLHQLQDAAEHLSTLIQRMGDSGLIDEEDFGIDLGHIYGHLNRAWNGRGFKEGIDEASWASCSEFPSDLGHVG